MIYFISNGEHIKIGQTTDSETTLRNLQEGSDKLLTLVHTVEGNIEKESDIHTLFFKYKVLGTWYSLPNNYGSQLELMDTILMQERDYEYHTPLALVADVGSTKAMIIEHLMMVIPRDDKAKINVIGLSKQLPISSSTAQRSIKELVEVHKYLKKHSRTEYSFTTRFFSAFPDYKNKFTI